MKLGNVYLHTISNRLSLHYSQYTILIFLAYFQLMKKADFCLFFEIPPQLQPQGHPSLLVPACPLHALSNSRGFQWGSDRPNWMAKAGPAPYVA